MTTSRTTTFREGDPIDWFQISRDGAEQARRGEVWALAEPVKAVGRAYWVQPLVFGGMRRTDNLPSPADEIWLKDGPVILVAVAGRQHRCGMAETHRFNVRGGRYIDKGEIYAETDPRARVHGKPPKTPPTHISGTPKRAHERTAQDLAVQVCEIAFGQ